MDGKGRAYDNIFIERLWRTVKYENIYMRDYRNIFEVRAGLEEYFKFYNEERYHQTLDYKTPAKIYRRGEKDLNMIFGKEDMMAENMERAILF